MTPMHCHPYLRQPRKPRPAAFCGEAVRTSYGSAIVQQVYWREPERIWRYRCKLCIDGAMVDCGQVTHHA